MKFDPHLPSVTATTFAKNDSLSPKSRSLASRIKDRMSSIRPPLIKPSSSRIPRTDSSMEEERMDLSEIEKKMALQQNNAFFHYMTKYILPLKMLWQQNVLRPGPASTVEECLHINAAILGSNPTEAGTFCVWLFYILCMTSILQISRSFETHFLAKHVSWRNTDFHSSLCERERSLNK